MFKLDTYEDWRHCIVDMCKDELTAEYIERRLKALNDQSDYNTQRFIEVWGKPHLARVIGWFERAKSELPNPEARSEN